MTPELWGIVSNFGPLGLMIGYLIWRETRNTDARHRAEVERTEADKALAAALSALTVTIQHFVARLDK